MKKITFNEKMGFNILHTTDKAQVAQMTLALGNSTGGPHNKHEKSDQFLYVIGGKGAAVVDGAHVKLSRYDMIHIEPGENHEIINTSDEPLHTLNIYTPSEY